MAKYLAPTQTVAINNNVLFNTDISGKCTIRHRDGSGVFTVKGSGKCCNPARYRVSAHVVVTATAAGPIRLALFEDGEVLTGTSIDVVAAAAGNILSGTAETEILAECDCSKITLKALTDAVPITSATMLITRVA